MKLLYLDIETTGTDHQRHGIHQISGMIEIDNEIVETFDFNVRPHDRAVIDPKALEVGGVTLEQIMAYEPMSEVYGKLIRMLSKYVDRYNKRDKMFIVGYNCQSFDIPFMRAWFKHNLDEWFGSYFWSVSHDVMILASPLLAYARPDMEDFKLKTVAKTLGIELDESKLHDGFYDIQITEKVYKKLCHYLFPSMSQAA